MSETKNATNEGIATDVIQVLRLQNGGQIVRGGGEIHIGRAVPSNGSPRLVLEEKRVSSHHCEVRLSEAGRPQLRDLGSRNGTWYGGMQILPHTWVDIDPGQKIGIVDYRFTIARVSMGTWEFRSVLRHEVTCQRPTEEEMVAAAMDILGLATPPSHPSSRHVLAVLHFHAFSKSHPMEFQAIVEAIRQFRLAAGQSSPAE